VRQRSARVVEVEPDAAPFPHAAQLASVEYQQIHKRSEKTQLGTRYFVTSLRPEETSPKQLATQIRGYWGIENKVHWRRDALGGEDRCRLHSPNAACALALLRTALIALVLRSGRRSLKEAQEEFALMPARALHLIRLQRLATTK
jgi:predicted transposase YbfD/YdcC